MAIVVQSSSRQCPSCFKTLVYSRKDVRDRAERLHLVCNSCAAKKRHGPLPLAKICPACGLSKLRSPDPAISGYFRRKSGKYESWCKECCRADNQARYDRATRVEYNRKWRADNPQKALSQKRKWRNNNRIKVRQSNRLRKFKLSAKGAFTAAEWGALQVEYDFACLRCHKKEPEISLQPDHVVPLSKDGGIGIANIQPLCGPCNSWKFTKTIDYRGEFHGAALV
jgi:5-methylcytosine-specific restriction endonuclease McrA